MTKLPVIKILVCVLSFALPTVSSGQTNEKPYEPYKAKADSIVKRFLNVFDQYVKLDYTRSKYVAAKGKGFRKTAFKDRLKSDPDFFLFHYVFDHPGLSGETFRIIFALDSSGEFILVDETSGLFNAENLNSHKMVSREEALVIARSEADQIQEKSIRLTWNDNTVDYEKFRQSRDLRDIWSGSMVWQVKGLEYFRGKTYRGVIYVDALTGQAGLSFPGIAWD